MLCAHLAAGHPATPCPASASTDLGPVTRQDGRRRWTLGLAALLGLALAGASRAATEATDAQPGLPPPLDPRARQRRPRSAATSASAASAASGAASGNEAGRTPRDPAARTREAVAGAVRAWAKAWSRRDAKAYIAAYAPGFISADRLQSYEDWVAQRRAELKASRSIEIRLEQLELDPKGDDWVASFRQHSLIDGEARSARRQLLLRRLRDRWLIVGERDDR